MPQPDRHESAAPASPSVTGDVRLLDNPIWNALNTEHRALALGDDLARRYPAEVGPLSGLVEQSAAAYEALRTLTGPGGVAALFLESPPEMRQGWSMVRGGLMSQMIWSGGNGRETTPLDAPAMPRKLASADVPAMVELARLTEPGPFGRRTHELGEFFGIFEGERLMAMAGQRTRLPGFVEVSAVCTHPDARGRGYARVVMAEVIADILRRGNTPFLHSLADNHSAIRVYKALGFQHRRSLHLAVLKSV
jgi:ribosomal protein S18 acetylase RimI-like enzyme